jgi:XTP/dITP diphosphohydrolase
MARILIASQNAHKISELKPLLEMGGFDVTDAREHALPEPEETGATFIDNARLKAQAASEATGMTVLADDSGMVIDALGEFPGVDTSPYTKKLGGYAQGVDDIFRRLAGRPSDAYYTSVIILLFPDGTEIVAQARTQGRLIQTRRGTGTFGYDPWFELTDGAYAGRTLAELSIEQKNSVSARALALKDLIAQWKTRG